MGDADRAVVTGGAGFIGAHLARRLAAEGLRVLVLDTGLAMETQEGGRSPGDAVALDVTEPHAARVIERFRPGLLVHAAAQTRVTASVGDPVTDARTNILGTLAMLDAARVVGAAGFVFLSSAAIYGEPRELPVRESHPTSPLSPYGLSKLAATRYVDYYREAGLVPSLSLIPANVYGPGQPSTTDGAVVPSFIEAALAGRPLPLDGDGRQTRDFIFVDDLVEAVWLTWLHLKAGTGRAGEEAVHGLRRARDEAAPTTEPGVGDGRAAHPARLNVGSGRETSIAVLADLVEKTAGRSLGRTYRLAPIGGIKRSALSSETATRALGWAPVVSLARGVELTMAAAARTETRPGDSRVG